MNYDEEFITEFNEFYPFERYILKEPKSITHLFDDATLTEIFIPSTEIKPFIEDGKYVGSTEVDKDSIYVKIKGPAGEMRLAYFDFASHVREEIRVSVMQDFGCWEDLYIEVEDTEELTEALNTQKELIIAKYGECKVKDSVCESNIELLNYD